MHINPDHFLVTEPGRIVTPERNKVAWEQCYRALADELARQGHASKVFLLIGPQGAGKSSWARSYAAENPATIIFDAILVKRDERAPILHAVNEQSGTAVAAWFHTPLDICIARNAARPVDERVPEQAIRNVYAALEPPSTDEGFDEVIVITPSRGTGCCERKPV
jgi:predicted kinase